MTNKWNRILTESIGALLCALVITSPARAATGTLKACTQMLAQLTPAVIESSARHPDVGRFMATSREERARLEAERAELAEEIAKYEKLIADDRLTLRGLDWFLDRVLDHPSVDAVPWAKRLKPLRKQMREVERDLDANIGGFEPKLFALIAAKSGSKAHYVSRLVSYLVDYGYRLEDVDYVLETLRAAEAEFAIIDSSAPPDAGSVRRGHHALRVRMSRMKLDRILKTRLRNIEAVVSNTMDLVPFGQLHILPREMTTSAELGEWIRGFESARATLGQQHERVKAKYEMIKSIAEKAVLP